jgi:hypothetical protein
MATQSKAGAPLTAAWPVRRPHFRRDRRRRQIGPVFEALEGRLVLSGASVTNPAPLGPKSTGTLTSQQLGAAYQQVTAVQVATLHSLGDSYRDVQSAGGQLARRAAGAIDELKAELTEVKSQRQADAVAAAIRRDLHLLDLGGADAARVEGGLDVARGIEDQQANNDEIYIPNGVFTNLTELVQQDRSTGTAISHTGRRAANALVRKLDGLGDQFASTISPLG